MTSSANHKTTQAANAAAPFNNSRRSESRASSSGRHASGATARSDDFVGTRDAGSDAGEQAASSQSEVIRGRQRGRLKRFREVEARVGGEWTADSCENDDQRLGTLGPAERPGGRCGE